MRFIVPSLVLVITACSSQADEEPVLSNSDSSTAQVADTLISIPLDSAGATIESTIYSAEVFETPGLGWGYKIFQNGTLFINQPHIPAVQGNKGFSSSENAKTTADFAILKLDQGFMPPTISPEELDSLGVLD